MAVSEAAPLEVAALPVASFLLVTLARFPNEGAMILHPFRDVTADGFLL
jgi:hypothetical protein